MTNRFLSLLAFMSVTTLVCAYTNDLLSILAANVEDASSLLIGNIGPVHQANVTGEITYWDVGGDYIGMLLMVEGEVAMQELPQHNPNTTVVDFTKLKMTPYNGSGVSKRASSNCEGSSYTPDTASCQNAASQYNDGTCYKTYTSKVHQSYYGCNVIWRCSGGYTGRQYGSTIDDGAQDTYRRCGNYKGTTVFDPVSGCGVTSNYCSECSAANGGTCTAAGIAQN